MKKNFDRLYDLNEQRKEELQKIKKLDARYESGKMSKEDYDKQNKAINTTIDTLGKETEEEIKNQGLSEQEYGEWKQQQEQGQDRGR